MSSGARTVNLKDIPVVVATSGSGSPVAVETIGNWRWILCEIETAGMKPQLVNANKGVRVKASGMNPCPGNECQTSLE